MNYTNFLETAKHWAAQLVAVGKPIEDDDLIGYVKGGLNPAFNSFITSMSSATWGTSLSFEDFQAKLLFYKLLLENQNQLVTSKAHQFAMFSPQQPLINSNA
jgi:hypothetical protein